MMVFMLCCSVSICGSADFSAAASALAKSAAAGFELVYILNRYG
jgi:hypothetical protein